jgi:hypothetical protein
LVDGLNKLGIGTFASYTLGGSIYISSYNQSVVYGQLSVVNSNANPINTNTLAIYDFGQSGFYSNSSTSVADTSGNNNNATSVTGTGVGTAANLSNFPYTVGTPSYLNMPNDPSHQYSVLLPNAYKFGGLAPYTMMAWFQSSGTITIPTNQFQGIISAEGRDIINGNPIGYQFYITFNGSNYSIVAGRWQTNTNTLSTTNLTFGSTITPAFSPNTWYFAMFGFDGSNMYLSIYANNGVRYDSTLANSYSLNTSNSWGAFLGLRYNNWLNGKLGYASIYNSWMGLPFFDNIYQQTKANYGY